MTDFPDDQVVERFDPVHTALIDLLPPGFLDVSDVERARTMLQGFVDAAPRPEVPDGVTMEEHTFTSHDGAEVAIRVWLPADTGALRGAYYSIHGGGMVLGNAAMNDVRCMTVASRMGAVATSVEYRLAPEHPHPTPIEDCYAGLKWLVTNADRFSIDLDRVAIGGGSAGAGLAAGLALLCRDRGGANPCFQLLTYPMLDHRNETPSSHLVHDTRSWSRAANAIAWEGYLGGNEPDAYASPSLAEDLTGLPPAIITVGEFDLFRDEDIDYAKRLLEAGVATELHVYPGAFHVSDVLGAALPMYQRWVNGELSALENAIGGE